MNTYRVIFVTNEVAGITIINYVMIEGGYYYEHSHGLLIYALINSETMNDAREIANKIAREFKTTNGMAPIRL